MLCCVFGFQDKKKKECFGSKNIEKLINGGTFMRYSREGTKFRLKMTLLNFWIKLTQKGYFQI